MMRLSNNPSLLIDRDDSPQQFAEVDQQSGESLSEEKDAIDETVLDISSFKQPDSDGRGTFDYSTSNVVPSDRNIASHILSENTQKLEHAPSFDGLDFTVSDEFTQQERSLEQRASVGQ